MFLIVSNDFNLTYALCFARLFSRIPRLSSFPADKDAADNNTADHLFGDTTFHLENMDFLQNPAVPHVVHSK